MKIRLARLHENAKNRPTGYLDAVMAKGVVDGEFLRISPHDYVALIRRFNPSALAPKRKGLGDLVEKMLRPFVKFSDKHFGTKFATCKPCQRRKKKLNEIGKRVLG